MSRKITATSNSSNLLNSIKATYDEVPYDSLAFAQSSPAHLRTIAKLFGVDAPRLENARILELGCASGGNIIPFALQFSNSQVVGVDLSEIQIAQGQELIKKLGIKNVELKACSITDIDETYGKFDYVITHGVFSWVPDFVRDKILEISSKNLSQNGVAYISYNTLPGWNTLRTVRDMAMFHSQSFSTPEEKVTQARLLLDFIKDAIKDSDGSYSKLIMESVELLKDKPDSYIFHDFLELNNKQYYFSEFINLAESHGLQYLSDTSISSMYIGNLPESTRSKFSETNDIIRTEQYIDYIKNRTFRSTLLCHNGLKINRNLNKEDIRNFFFRMNIISTKALSETDIKNTEELIEFHVTGQKSSKLSTKSAILKAILYSCVENSNRYINFEELLKLSLEKLKSYEKLDIEREMENNLLNLVLMGYASILRDQIHANFKVSSKPKASEYAVIQCKHFEKSLVSNLYHDNIGLDLFESFMIRYLDGENTKEEILNHLAIHADNGQLSLHIDNQKIQDRKQILEIFSELYDQSIEKFAQNALLV